MPSTAWKVRGVANGRICIESLGLIWCLHFREKKTNNGCVNLFRLLLSSFALSWIFSFFCSCFCWFILLILFALILIELYFFSKFSKAKNRIKCDKLVSVEKNDYGRREKRSCSKVTSSGQIARLKRSQWWSLR